MNEAMSILTYPVYDPLPHSSEYLRILTIHAGGVLEPIRCSLRTVSFREKPSYDALSYTWGDPNATKSIEVDGITIQVTFNLEQALLHLRDVENDLALWVDAVCINQLDTSEKSHQVAVMGRIYRQCAQVQIWLGCDTSQCRLTRSSCPMSNAADDSSEGVDPFEIIRLLADDQHIHEWPCFRPLLDYGWGGHAYRADESFDIVCEGFLAIDRSPWWTRMWTVQEAILPKAGLLIYDIWTTSLQTVTDCGRDYYKHAWTDCCRDAVSKLPGTVRTALEEFCSVAVTLHGDRKRDDNGDLEQYDLQAQHTAYGFRACEDPRDKVYGLLGIVDDQFFTPDYTLCKGEVFFQATYRMICRGRGTLKSLTGPQYGPAPGKWASWVRNFDAPFDRLDADIACDRYTLHDSGIFDASDSHKSSPVLLKAQARPADGKANQMGLELVGRRVGIVTFVSQDVPAKISDNEGAIEKHVFRQWILEALNYNIIDGLGYNPKLYPNSPSVNSDIVMRFWRTLLGGVGITHSTEIEDWNKFTPATMFSLQSFLSWLRRDRSALTMALARIISVATHGRCYFKAENNDQGLCHPGACAGDEVWVLDGGRVPFILRSTYLDHEERQALKPVDAHGFGNNEQYESREGRQSDKAPEGYYLFIGDCYFDGYMNGEAVRNNSFREHSIVLV